MKKILSKQVYLLMNNKFNILDNSLKSKDEYI